jgi:hypothetical protein
MSKNKNVSIKSIKSLRKNNSAALEQLTDEWVGVTQTSTVQEIASFSPESLKKNKTEPEKINKQLSLIEESRFTIVIPTYLHTRIKKHCVVNGTPMKALLTEILLKEFPER